MKKKDKGIVMPANWKITALAWKAGQMDLTYGEFSLKLGVEYNTEDIYEEYKAHYIAEKEEEKKRIAESAKRKEEKNDERSFGATWHMFFQPDRSVKSSLPGCMRDAIQEEENGYEAAIC